MYYYFVVSAFLGGIVALGTGIFIYCRNNGKVLNKIYGLLSISSGLWCLGQWGYFTADTYGLALLYSRLSNLVALFIPVFYLHFILLLTELKRRKLLIVIYFLLFIFSLFSFSPVYIQGMRPQLMFKWFTQGGVLFDIFGAFFVLNITYALWRLVLAVNRSEGHKKVQLTYILVASVLGFIGGGTTFPLVYGIPFPPYGLILF